MMSAPLLRALTSVAGWVDPRRMIALALGPPNRHDQVRPKLIGRELDRSVDLW